MKKKKLADRTAELIASLTDDELVTIKVDEIAFRLKVNPSYLSRKFKRDKVMSLNDFITGVKMNRSANLLAGPEKITMYTMAQKTGFARADYFVILFKKFFGIHPKKYNRLKTTGVPADD